MDSVPGAGADTSPVTNQVLGEKSEVSTAGADTSPITDQVLGEKSEVTTAGADTSPVTNQVLEEKSEVPPAGADTSPVANQVLEEKSEVPPAGADTSPATNLVLEEKFEVPTADAGTSPVANQVLEEKSEVPPAGADTSPATNLVLEEKFEVPTADAGTSPVTNQVLEEKSEVPNAAAHTNSVINQVLGKTSDVPPGTKKVFTVNEKPILVINDNGKLYATTGICSHYNYSLENGIYSNGRIRCTLHGACFNVRTGDIEDYPGFDSLFTYDVQDVNGDLVLNTTEEQLASARRTRKCNLKATCNDAPIIVVGAGISAAAFAEHARLNGCPTPITMITEDEIPPYDRVLLSKKPTAEAKDIRLRSDDFYKENFINVVTNARVTGVDLSRRKVQLWTGDTMQYSKLVLALGGTPRKLTCPGADLKNVFTLRTISDANTIAEQSKGKHVVCIGGSFIGMEIASSLAGIAESVTVVCNTEEPLPVLGSDVGAVIRNRFEAKGVRVLVKEEAASLEGTDVVLGVTLKSGLTLAADVVVVGIGVVPPTDWLKRTNIELDERGFIKVDHLFRTTADWVYAIGDAVSAPLPLWDIEDLNIQHFQTAQAHGQLLGYSIVGRPYPTQLVPFFWTLFFFEFGIRFAGCAQGSSHVIVHGSIADLKFTKYYFKDDVVVAVANAGPVPVAIHFLEIFKRKIKVTREDVEKNEGDDWLALLE